MRSNEEFKNCSNLWQFTFG